MRPEPEVIHINWRSNIPDCHCDTISSAWEWWTCGMIYQKVLWLQKLWTPSSHDWTVTGLTLLTSWSLWLLQLSTTTRTAYWERLKGPRPIYSCTISYHIMWVFVWVGGWVIGWECYRAVQVEFLKSVFEYFCLQKYLLAPHQFHLSTSVSSFFSPLHWANAIFSC